MPSSNFTPIRPVKRSALTAFIDVVFAIFMRELKTRFGGMKLGIAWLLLEPIAFVLVFSLMFSFRSAGSVTPIPIPMMILTGLLAFKFWQTSMTALANSATANKALFSYRQVKPLDCVISRALLENLIFICTFYILLALFGWYGFDVRIDDPLKVLSAYTLLFMFGAGLGMTIAVVALKFPDITKIVSLFSMPLMFVSGSFFTADMIPQAYWKYFSWNPIFQAIEMGRDGFFVNLNSQFVNYQYLVLSSLGTFTLGLTLFQLNKMKFVSS
ncbi:MAG: ABC transporter permease [Saccharospirillaceae bacterium]|nr:ABC transporter permease [Saccharospirillaceae bacterium]